MFVLTIYIQDTAQPITASFKTETCAGAICAKIVDPEDQSAIEFEDDFGVRVCVLASDVITAFRLADAAKEFEAAGDMAILNQKATIKANQKAMNDPAIKFAMQGGVGSQPMIRA